MPWVERNDDGSVRATYASRQPGAAEEFLGDDHAEIAALSSARDAASMIIKINDERDRRVARGFKFQGIVFQCRSDDQINISGAGILAFQAIAAGAPQRDFRWHGGDADFTWIAADNTLVTMDAQTVIAFGQAAAAWKLAHVFAARALKDAAPIPANFFDDAFWPSKE